VRGRRGEGEGAGGAGALGASAAAPDRLQPVLIEIDPASTFLAITATNALQLTVGAC
jgi:hypothetical protein